jgi:hypothetical protein
MVDRRVVDGHPRVPAASPRCGDTSRSGPIPPPTGEDNLFLDLGTLHADHCHPSALLSLGHKGRLELRWPAQKKFAPAALSEL